MDIRGILLQRSLLWRIDLFLCFLCLTSAVGCREPNGYLVISPEVVNLAWNPQNQGRQEVRVKLQNTGHATLKIKNIVSSCTCTVASSGKKEIPAGDSTDLSLTVQALEYGNQELFVTVETDSAATPTVIVKINSKQREQSLPDLWHATESIHWKFRKKDESLTTSVEIVTAEKAEEDDWISGLEFQPTLGTQIFETQFLGSSQEDLGGGAVCRKYHYGVSTKPTRLDSETINCRVNIKTANGTRSWICPVTLDYAPAVRLLPKELDFAANEQKVLEASLLLIADDEMPFEIQSNGNQEWGTIHVEEISPDSSTLRKRLTIRIDSLQKWNESFQGTDFTLQLSHPECSQISIPWRCAACR